MFIAICPPPATSSHRESWPLNTCTAPGPFDSASRDSKPEIQPTSIDAVERLAPESRVPCHIDPVGSMARCAATGLSWHEKCHISHNTGNLAAHAIPAARFAQRMQGAHREQESDMARSSKRNSKRNAGAFILGGASAESWAPPSRSGIPQNRETSIGQWYLEGRPPTQRSRVTAR